jgi:hypothetical protein
MRIVLGLLLSLYGLGASPFDSLRPTLINRPIKAFYNSTNASVAVLAAGLSPARVRGGVANMARDSEIGMVAENF